jgi:hypothetical protein
MISQECNIVEFVGAMKGKPYSEILMLANHEATLAERCLYRREKCPADDTACIRYSKKLKDLIFYLRYSTRPAGAGREDRNLYQNLLDDEREKAFQLPFRSAGRSVYYLPSSPLSS